MNHKFVKTHEHHNCASCGYNIVAHTPFALCEVCNKKGTCEILSGRLTCAQCATSSDSVSSNLCNAGSREDSQTDITDTQQEEFTAEPVKPQVVVEPPGIIEEKELSTSAEFFNFETKAIVDIEAEINAKLDWTREQKNAELVARIRARYLSYKEVLFQALQIQVEMNSKQRAQQHYLNKLADGIRKEERDKLRLHDVSYVPKEAPTTKAKAPKIGTDEKIAQNLAKVMNISIEQARILVKKQLDSVGIKCSCKETPGICKVHNA